jgi:hypothetical protein
MVRLTPILGQKWHRQPGALVVELECVPVWRVKFDNGFELIYQVRIKRTELKVWLLGQFGKDECNRAIGSWWHRTFPLPSLPKLFSELQVRFREIGLM